MGRRDERADLGALACTGSTCWAIDGRDGGPGRSPLSSHRPGGAPGAVRDVPGRRQRDSSGAVADRRSDEQLARHGRLGPLPPGPGHGLRRRSRRALDLPAARPRCRRPWSRSQAAASLRYWAGGDVSLAGARGRSPRPRWSPTERWTASTRSPTTTDYTSSSAGSGCCGSIRRRALLPLPGRDGLRPARRRLSARRETLGAAVEPGGPECPSAFRAFTAADTAWDAGAPGPHFSSSATSTVADADSRFAHAFVAFDESLLDWGASGTPGALVTSLVTADDKVMTDVLALTGSPPATWSATVAADSSRPSRRGCSARGPGLGPISTTTTFDAPRPRRDRRGTMAR